MPTNARFNFDKAIVRVDSLLEVHQELVKQKGRPPLWLSDLLRSIVVFALAALDSYIHDVICENAYKVVGAKKGVNLPKKLIEVLKEIVPYDKSVAMWFNKSQAITINNSIRKRNADRTYMKPDKIEDGLAILGVENLWVRTAKTFGMRKDGLKTHFKAYAERRDKIAHEGDLGKATSAKGKLRSITRPYVLKCLKDIKKMVHAIDDIVVEKIT